MTHYRPDQAPCAKLIEDYEEAELNWFIKYGELGWGADAADCYMKQKHRMIWERRHPEIMAERQRLYEEHKRQLEGGHFDWGFWKKGMPFLDKTRNSPPEQFTRDVSAFEMGEKPISKDWQYYKRRAEDPTFDAETNRQK